MADRFPGVEVIRLPVNHRSTPQVVDTGRHVLRPAGIPVDVDARRDDGIATRIQTDGDRILFGSSNGTVRVVEIATGRVA